MKQLFEFMTPVETNSKMGELLCNITINCGLTPLEAEVDKEIKLKIKGK